MKKKLLAELAVGVMMFGMVGMAQATSYNATTDFSITNGNPNGVWTYGWMSPADFSTFNTYTNVYDGSTLNNPMKMWNTPGTLPNDYPAYVAINDTPTAQYSVEPGQLTLHPGEGGEASVLRFIAPTTSLYDIDGQFFSGDSGIMPIGIRQGTEWLWQGLDAGIFSLDISMTAGTSIDFLVFTGAGGHWSGNTPLELTVSSAPVPEPATLLLMGTGLAGLIGARWKKKQ